MDGLGHRSGKRSAQVGGEFVRVREGERQTAVSERRSGQHLAECREVVFSERRSTGEVGEIGSLDLVEGQIELLDVLRHAQSIRPS